MQTMGAPSLQLMFLLTDAFAEVSLFALNAAWKRWVGSERLHRKLTQFARAGWIEPPASNHGTERVMRFTRAGRAAALFGRDPEACWARPWDGRWRMVLFDVPETDRKLRSALRRKLRSLGFGYLQNSAWITPDPVDAFKEAIGKSPLDVETLSFVEARPCAGETDADLVWGAWDFRRIARGYDRHRELLRSAPTTESSSAACARWFEAEYRAWRLAVGNDPLLPAVLLPPCYRGREAWQERTIILRRLLSRH